MYSIDDVETIIRDIQGFLLLIAEERGDTSYAPTEKNGIYDESTRSAVKYYQKKTEIEESGVVDEETFYAIYNDYIYHNTIVENREKHPIDVEFPLGYGASHKDITGINTMLSDVSIYYYGASDIKKNSYFSKNTETAVINLRKIFGLSDSDMIDEEFYLILSEEHKLINERMQNKNTAF